jgi:Zn-dependent peptidase ImmA (M78 family)
MPALPTQIVVNAEVLIWARESLAVSVQSVSERTKLSTSKIAQFERGEKQPSIDELKLLAKTYKRSLAALLLQAPPPEKPFLKDFRTTDSIKVDSFDEKTIMAVRKARALAASYIDLKTELELFLPKFELTAKLTEEPRLVAKRIRPYLQYEQLIKQPDDKHALEFAIEALEELGVLTFQLSLTKDEIRGFAISDEAVPIIGLKGGGERVTAKIFSLFHELGHILLKQNAICDVHEGSKNETEKWCNALAAEILVPQELLLAHPLIEKYASTKTKEWSNKDLEVLAKKFHVGPLMMLRRLLTFGFTTKEFYSARHQVMNKPSFGRAKDPKGRDIPAETLKEKGRSFVSMAFNAFDRNHIDILDLSGYLGVSMKNIEKTRELLRQ